MDPRIKKGDRVLLQLRANEMFEGTVVRVLSNSVEICKIYCYSTGSSLEDLLTFYRDEIVSIRHIQSKEALQNGESESQETNNASKRKSSGASMKNIIIPEPEFYRLRDMGLNFIYVDRFDEKYRKAMDVLYERESLAIAGLGFGRTKRISVLVISDFKQAYIFDMKNMLALRGIEGLLTSEYVVKIVHDGALLYDCLYHAFRVEMKNVFDTQVTDTILSKKEGANTASTDRDLSECLAHRFNLPPALASEDVNSPEWHDRPLSRSQKTRACQLVIYLSTLRDHLQKLMMKDVIECTQKRYAAYTRASDLQLANMVKEVNLNGHI